LSNLNIREPPCANGRAVPSDKVGVSSSRIDERVALRIGRDTRHFAEIQIRRQLQRFDRDVVRHFGHDELRRERRDGEREDAGCKLNRSLHVRPPYLAAVVVGRAGAAGWLQHQLLHAPRFDFGNDDLVRIAAVHHVDDLEAAKLFAGVAELSEDGPIELHLVDLACDVPRPGRVAVRVGSSR
jgi:hypothetical protein